MIDLSGRTILVTGATSGIGLAASEQLAGMRAELILVGRDPVRLERAAAAVRARSGSGAVSILRHDLSSMAEVRALAAKVRERWPRLHVVVNNAGGVNGARELTADGLERTLAVNHLAPYLLTRLLLDHLVESRPARVVTVSSGFHRRARLDLSDLQLERGYAMMRAYGASKLANVLFTRELARRFAGSGVAATCLHPGVVATRIWSRAPLWMRPFLALASLFMLTPEQGAETVVYLASSPEAEPLSGVYLEQGRVVEPAPQARDDVAARRLWDESARLVGLDP
jgi:retinol dehydrogenase 14